MSFPTSFKLLICICWLLCPGGTTNADSISAALAQAYTRNPDLNQARAGGRASDEGVALAASALRPRVTGSGITGLNRTRQSGTPITSAVGAENRDSLVDAAVIPSTAFLPTGTFDATTNPSEAQLSVTKNVFDGNRSANGVRQAETRVLAARERIRLTEQTILRDAATVYMDVLRDAAVLDLNRNNILVLEEQTRQTGYRLEAGKVTPTDKAQAESSLARARSQFFLAQARLQTSSANYCRIIGAVPHRLEAARPIDALLPRTLDAALASALSDHPLVAGALHDVDVAQLEVQIAEAALYPTLDVVGDLQGAHDFQGIPGDTLTEGSVYGRTRIPLYTGGADYAKVRQAKELLTQAQLRIERERDAIRASVIARWYALLSSREIIRSTSAAVDASERALRNVRDEAAAGKRTVLDILVAQQTLLQARVNLISAQRDRVVDGYEVLASIGRLSAATLGLVVQLHDPTVHLDQVKDKWSGLRTPDGR